MVAAARIDDIQSLVAIHFGLHPVDMRSTTRIRRIARPRQIAMSLVRQFTKASLPVIGREFGGRDHTTIIAGIRRVALLSAEDPDFACEMDALREKVQSALMAGNTVRLGPGEFQRRIIAVSIIGAWLTTLDLTASE